MTLSEQVQVLEEKVKKYEAMFKLKEKGMSPFYLTDTKDMTPAHYKILAALYNDSEGCMIKPELVEATNLHSLTTRINELFGLDFVKPDGTARYSGKSFKIYRITEAGRSFVEGEM